jgi:hypothetical protein
MSNPPVSPGFADGQVLVASVLNGVLMAKQDYPAITQPQGTNDATIATTAFVNGAVTANNAIFAPLNSPAFTGTPTAPTVTPGLDNSNKIATTAFVQSAVVAISSGVTAVAVGTGLTGGGSGYVNIGLVTPVAIANGGTNATSASAALANLGGAALTGALFTGPVICPTPSVGDNSTLVATTAFVDTAITNVAVPTPSTTLPNMDGTAAIGALTTKYALPDHVHPSDMSRAPLASPVFTGVPAAPTATAGTNTTQLATTAFVGTAIANIPNIPLPSSTVPLVDATPGLVGTSTAYARGDHVHPSDTSRAPLASPTFTGVPAAPTASVGTSTTQLATTAFVGAAITNVASSTSPLMDGTAAVGIGTAYARADHVHPSDTSRAPLASPAFTGTPLAPTTVAGTSNQQIATTAFVMAAVNTGGIFVALNVYTTSQTITIPAKATQAIIQLWGGSGGSGSSFYSTYPTGVGGTGAGGFLIKRLSGLTSGNTFVYSQGAAGAAGVTSGSGNGGSGGTSSIVSGTQSITTLTANGSGGSAFCNGEGVISAGTAGGSASGGDFNVVGQSGSKGYSDGSGGYLSGRGGVNMYSVGADGTISTTTGLSGRAGGCIIWWFT